MSRDNLSVLSEDEAAKDTTASASPTTTKKRKLDQAELEVDINAPEPPSKKALRKAKKAKGDNANDTTGSTAPAVKGAEDIVPNRGKRSEHGIWIGNLSFTTTKQDLLTFMTSDTDHTITEDKVTRINLPAGPAKHGKFQNKGFAYIDLADADSLSKALELSEKLFGGRRVLIKNAASFEGRPKEKKDDNQDAAVNGKAPSKRMFVGNLAFDTTVEDLEEHFGVCGSIVHTHMATFEDSGKCKGYAWVEFEQLSSAQAAMRGWVEEGRQQEGQVKRSDRRIWLHKMQGRKLRLEYAEDKVTRYQKRFGKDAPKSTSMDNVNGRQNEDADEKEGGRGEVDDAEGGQRRPERRQRGRRLREGGYAEDTVTRLTGAIVEAKGNKMTFD